MATPRRPSPNFLNPVDCDAPVAGHSSSRRVDAHNERRLDDLVQDTLTYNGETMTRRHCQHPTAADLTF